MRYSKMLRIFSLVIVIAMLAMAVPVTAQTRFIEIEPEEGTIGSEVVVVGEGFNASSESSDKYAILYFSSQEASEVDDIDSDVTVYEIIRDGIWLDYDGAFEEEFTVPERLDDGEDEDDYEDVTAGTYYVYLCHYLNTVPPTVATRIRAVAEFTVIGGKIKIDPDEGPVGVEVEIIGSEFAADEEITVSYDDTEIDIESGDDETDKNGEFECTIFIPESTAGEHTITVAVGGSEAEAEFIVEPELVLDPTSGDAGAEVSVSGTGFGRRSDVGVYFNNVGVATKTTGSGGSFEATFTVPEVGAGIYDVEAEDDDRNLFVAKFTVTGSEPTQPAPSPTPPPATTAVNLSTTSGQAGSDLIITGAGFQPGGIVTIKFGDEVLDTMATDASGIFVAVIKVPSAKAGEHTISISDGTNTEELTFTLKAEPPPIPGPLLPKMGGKVKTPVVFDWEDVAAAAGPVSYDLQVATDEDFDGGSMVLEKMELVASEYATSEAESIALADGDTLYYWRVRAVDAMGNEGEWSGAGEFYVKKPFSFPTWATYTLLGLGGLILFAVGYWMGRRTAYYYTF